MRFGVTRITGVVALLVAGAAPALAGQATLPVADTWTLEGNRGGYCIWYLADPDLARKMVPSSTQLTPAGTGAGLPSLLVSIIREEPRFAQWIPGAICFGLYQRVSSGSRSLAEGKPNRPIVIATSSLAAQNAHGVEGATDYLLDFLTDNRSLASAADRIGVDMNMLEYVSRVRVEGGDPAVTINLSGTIIDWSGHALSDSSVGRTRSVSFGYGGPKSANRLVRLELAPASSRLVVGSLSIDGRNNLAKALLASPARPIGPQESGGKGSIMFHGATKK